MRFLFRRYAAAGVVAGLLAGALVVAAPAGAQGTATPWAGSDQNAIAGLTFYDAAGNIITGGSTSTAPFAAYAEGRARTRTTVADTKATLFAYVPQVGVNPAVWSTNEQLGLSTTFPNRAAPAPVKNSTLPVNSGTSSDISLDSMIADLGGTSSATDYQNIYEIRMITSAPGASASAQYDYADIAIDTTAHTWKLVYTPGDVTTVPNAPRSVRATPGASGSQVSWSAPADNGGPAVSGYDVQYSSNNGASWTSSSPAFRTSTATSQFVTGLTNGTSYVFRVAAINSVGTGSYSAASVAVTPSADPSAIAISGPAGGAYGSTARLSATLLNARTGAPIANATVVLARRGVSGGFVAIASAVTSATGSAGATVRLTSYGQYVWLYGGATDNQAVGSAVRVMTVTQTVSAARSASTVKRGNTVSVFGTVNPVSAGGRVYLQQLVRGTWRTLSTNAVIKRQKLPNRSIAVGFVLTVKLSVKGSNTYRVYKPAVIDLLAGYSAPQTVRST